MESAPTGCFKCGRPGHWSRDCPSSAPVAGNSAPSSSSAPSQIPNNEFQRSSTKSRNPIGAVPKVTKKRVQRPKLTPDLLLSEDGLGYVLRYFPKSFKYRGRGKEASRFLVFHSPILLILLLSLSFHRIRDQIFFICGFCMRSVVISDRERFVPV